MTEAEETLCLLLYGSKDKGKRHKLMKDALKEIRRLNLIRLCYEQKLLNLGEDLIC